MCSEKSSTFYESLPCFKAFSGVANPNNFEQVPNDWVVVVTDIRGSTQAIEQGRYRDVNTIGAATIVTARKVMGHLDFPFVFGGDGSTLLVPSLVLAELAEQLISLKLLAKNKFDLELRVGAVEVSTISQHKKTIRVAKLEITDGRCLAVFSGGGLSLADKLIKEDEKTYTLKAPSPARGEVDLKGLSCRWNPLPPSKDKIVSLIIEANSDLKDSEAIYRDVLAAFDSVFDSEWTQSNPINLNGASYKSIRRCLKDERRYHQSLFTFSFLSRAIEIVLAVFIFKLGMRPLVFDSKKYTDSMKTHSDYRKFDDALRMTLDCSTSQVEELKRYLEEKHTQGVLYYGMFETDHTLMTCYVDGLEQGQHIHFVDGGNGGYAVAAKQLKAQKNS